MFEDSVRTLNAEDKIKIKDVAELLLESLDINVAEPVADVCTTS